MINQLVQQRYEVVEKIGEGALFTVYKARDRARNRVVAVKSLLAPFRDDHAFLESLRSGAATAANLNHAGLTRLLEFGEEDGAIFVVWEFVRGVDMKERIRRIAPFTLSIAIDFACVMGEALNYLHSAGLAHGDLRPQNIIISPEGAAKITDFGIQRAIARCPAAREAVLRHAAPYHAPELSIAAPGTVAGDIYAVGAILYEMLTGTTLYTGETPEQIADQHALSAIPFPHALNPGVPRSVEGIILKCLQKRPDQRYRSAADMLSDLKSVRDALRFGKPLSWSPIDLEKLASDGAKSAPLPEQMPSEGGVGRATRRQPRALELETADSQPMPTRNRLRAEDERISIYLRVAIGTVTAIIITSVIFLFGIWSSMWVAAKPVPVPELVGKPIEEVRKLAKQMHVKLKEHSEYSRRPREIVYKSDQDRGAKIQPGHTINVWYSLGSEYVFVPNVTRVTQDVAIKRLTDSGLAVGQILTEFNDRIPSGQVIRQTVSSKKRVLHDTKVDLVVSEGKKPEWAAGDSGASDPARREEDATGETAGNPEVGGSAESGSPAAAHDPSEDEQHTFDRAISIPADNKGARQVRIVYTDSHGPPVTVIDEQHSPSDRIPLNFSYFGKTINLKIYYDGELAFNQTFDPEATRRVRIPASGIGRPEPQPRGRR